MTFEELPEYIIFYRRMRKNSVPSFIEKAWEMLESTEHEHIIHWRPQGESFEILNDSLFCSELLPRYFKHSNFSSFIRQVPLPHSAQHVQLPQTQKPRRRGILSPALSPRSEVHHQPHRQLLIGIRRKPSEAEILQGEELIRKLAPECIKGMQVST